MSRDFEFHRRSIRLPGYDYSQPGMYFVTICAREREVIFGNIVDGVMVTNDAGMMVCDIWHDIPNHNPDIGIDVSQIMPDHFHGIIVIDKPVGAGSSRPKIT